MYASFQEYSISGLPHYHVPRFVSTLNPVPPVDKPEVGVDEKGAGEIAASRSQVSFPPGPPDAGARSFPATIASAGPGGPRRSEAGKDRAEAPSVAAFPVSDTAFPDQQGSGEVHMISSVEGEREQLEEQMKRRHISPLAVKKAHSLFGRGSSKASSKKKSSTSAKSKKKSPATSKAKKTSSSSSKSKKSGVSKAKKSPSKKKATTSGRGKKKA